MEKTSDELGADEAEPTVDCRVGLKAPRVSYSASPTDRSHTRTRTGSEPEQRAEKQSDQRRESSRERRKFLALREGALGLAIDGCLSYIVSAEDGQHLGTYLLSQIDHWDFEKERVFMIMENVVIAVKFDFCRQQVISACRLPYYGMTKVISGKFTYPRRGIAKEREGIGLRIHYGDDGPPLLSELNPWAKDIPYWTITSHILYRQYNVTDDRLKLEAFTEQLFSSIHSAYSRLQEDKDSKSQPELERGDIYMGLYTNITAVVHNSQHMGYFKQNLFP